MISAALRSDPVTEPREQYAAAPPCRVLYIRDTLIVCGPGKTILNTWRTIDRDRFELTIASTQPEPGRRNALLDAARHSGARAITFKIGRGIDLLAVWRLARLLRDERIDVLQTHDAPTRRIGVLAAALTRTLHVTSVHGWIFNDIRGRAVRRFEAPFIRWADAVITVSDRLRQEMIAAGVSPSKITVLPNAILVSDYATGSGADSPLRQELGVRESDLVVSIVGRLSLEKGHEVFLNAARLIIDDLPAVKFLIVGEGPLEDSLKARVQELGLQSQVIFTGHRADLSQLYRMTDVLVISSFTEGIPNVLLEAFAYGKPVVATTVGGIPEVLRNGLDGWLVTSGDHQAIAARVVALLRDPETRRQMGSSARAAIETQFNFVDRTRAVERLWIENLARRASLGPQRNALTRILTAMRKSVALLRSSGGKALRTTSQMSERVLRPHRHRKAIARVMRLQPRSILVICFGNICRSPYAASILARTLDKSGVLVASSGFIKKPGRPSPDEAQAAAKVFGIDLRQHRSDVVTSELLRMHDLIVVMEPWHAKVLVTEHQCPPDRILILGDLDPDSTSSRTIPDPYDGSTEVFLECYRRIEACIHVLADSVTQALVSDSRQIHPRHQ